MTIGKVSGRCPTCKRPYKRSSEQNRYYWSMLGAISNEMKYKGAYQPPKFWHEYFKLIYLGAQEMELPNGKNVVIVESSANLNKEEFGEYVDKVDSWAADHGVYDHRQ